jgi:glycosyltransferase involved in cell wall biosynthesis
MNAEPELSIVMPCLNEAETLAVCIRKARGFLQSHDVAGEILVADNGSTDGSRDIARAEGARVIEVPERGYGAALMAGIQAAEGHYVVMGDADDSYDFARLTPFMEKLRDGFDLVMGNRFLGGIAPGAMPPLHRYLGNPVLSFVGKLFFKSPVGDFHCGLRGFRRKAILSLNLRAPGMEFASEMVVKATLRRLRITEVPTTLSPDGRSRAPHLRSWRDGWRHLRFLLIFSPRWLFLYPGLTLIISGLLLMAILAPQRLTVGGIGLDIHTLLYAAFFTLIGFQLVFFSIFSKMYGIQSGLLPPDTLTEKFLRVASLEKGMIAGIIVAGTGIAGSVLAVYVWGKGGFRGLDPRAMMRVTIPSATAIALGIQIVFGSFFMTFLRGRADE